MSKEEIDKIDAEAEKNTSISFIMKEVDCSFEEAIEIYNDRSPPNLNSTSVASNLLGWWKMDGSDTAPTATDSKGSNNGTYVNTPTFQTVKFVIN
jgi:hypothetical protein